MTSEESRLARLETHIEYIKDKVSCIPEMCESQAIHEVRIADLEKYHTSTVKVEEQVSYLIDQFEKRNNSIEAVVQNCDRHAPLLEKISKTLWTDDGKDRIQNLEYRQSKVVEQLWAEDGKARVPAVESNIENLKKEAEIASTSRVKVLWWVCGTILTVLISGFLGHLFLAGPVLAK